MKKKDNEKNISNQEFLSRIIIKFRDSFNLAYHEMKETNDFFLKNGIIFRKQPGNLLRGISINNLFTSIPPQKIIGFVDTARSLNSDYLPPNFLNYYAINCPAGYNTILLLEVLLKNQNVEWACIENNNPPPPSFERMNPLSICQGYLNPAPVGVDAKYAWNMKGGDGHGKIKFVDIEQGWLLDHEDIVATEVPGTGINCKAFQDHGAAVLGVIMMLDNSIGGIGITPNANGHVISQWRPDGSLNTADAIMTALDYIAFGDIILLEAQAVDAPGSGQFWPVEIQETVFQVIRLATALGITMIEASGNGNRTYTTGNDLDLFVDRYGRNILNRSSGDFRDSGAIMVAASTKREPHERIRYTNYGSRIDCYAWGEGVATAGNFPKSSYGATDIYTGKFCGTSSAAAIVAGVAIAVQSISEANYHVRLSPKQLRHILGHDKYGTSSAYGISLDKIGVMPDLKKIIEKKFKRTKSLKHFVTKAV